MSALERLKNDALSDKALDPPTVEWDEVTRVRGTYAAGAVAAWFLARADNENTQEVARATTFVRNLVATRRTLIWGESAMPFFVVMVIFLANTSADRVDEGLLMSLIRAISDANGRRSKRGIPDPYQDADSILEGEVRRLKKSTPRPRSHTGRSYSLEGLVFLAARRLLRSHLTTHWTAITYVDFIKFIPLNINDFLLWHTDEGSLDSRQPGKPQSWAKLLIEARSKNYLEKLPSAILSRPNFALLLALVFPQRLTSDLTLFLDDSFLVRISNAKSR